eukprot:1890922-Pleurochrysis_carterae.AAC.1
MKTNLLKTERTPAPIVFSFEILSSQRGSAPPTRKLPELFEADQPVTVQVHLFQQRVHLKKSHVCTASKKTHKKHPGELV